MNPTQKNKTTDFLIEDIHRHSRDPLSYRDLLLILTLDPEVREILRKLISEHTHGLPDSPDLLAEEEEVSGPEEMTEILTDEEQAPRHEEKEIPKPDPFMEEMAPLLKFLHLAETHMEICGNWLNPEENRAQNLMRLLAHAANWDEIERLWDSLCSRCKSSKKPATKDEVEILQYSVKVHNLLYRSRKAELVHEKIGVPFDPDKHHRATLEGRNVSAIWLPGLANASGEIRKKPLTVTD